MCSFNFLWLIGFSLKDLAVLNRKFEVLLCVTCNLEMFKQKSQMFFYHLILILKTCYK